MKNIFAKESEENFEKRLEGINPKNYWIVSGILACMLSFLSFSFLGALGTGKYVILNGDSMLQFAPAIKSMADSIRNGESIWYSFGFILGTNEAYQLMFTCWSPFNLLYILLGFLDVETITQIVLILKISCAAMAFTVFARKVVKVKGPESIFFSLCYAYGGYTVCYGIVNFMFLDSVIILPLLLSFVVYSFEEKKGYYLVTILYALSFITNFHLGYSAGIFTLVFVLAYIILLDKDASSKDKVIKLVKWVGCVCSAILISGVFLLPGILQFFASGYEDDIPYHNRGISVFHILSTLFWGAFSDSKLDNSMLYSGLPVFALLPLFFFERNIEKKKRLFWGVIFGIFVVAMSITPIYYALSAFDMPDYYNYRFGFVVSLTVCTLAMMESEKISELSFKKILITVFSLIVFGATMTVFNFVKGGNLSKLMIVWGINVGIFALWFAFVSYLKKSKSSGLTKLMLAFVLIFVELGSFVFVVFYGNLDKRIWYENYARNLKINADTIADEDKGFYRIISVGDEVDNSAELFDFNSVNGFASCRNENVSQVMNNLGFADTPRTLASSGYTPVTNMLFGVKYMINPGYYLVCSETPQITIPTVNTNVLNLGYMVEDGVKDVSIEGRNVFDNSNMILQRMTGLDGEVFVPHNTYDVISNGIVYDEETFSLKRNANEAGYILFTVPYDENYQGAYLQFENPYSVYSLEDLLFVSGGENIYGIGNRILASQANKMSPVEGQDIYALRIDADADAPTEYIFYGVNMVYYSQETLDEYYADLADEQLAVEEWKDGYVKGRITVNSDRRLLFLSIPYEKGWNITVNGKKVEPLAVVDDAFMAIELPGKGTYDIEMKFNCPGVIMGLIVTLTGVIMTAIMYFIQKKKSDKISAIKNDETHAEDDSLNVKTLQAEEEEENAVSSDEGNNAEHDTNTEE